MDPAAALRRGAGVGLAMDMAQKVKVWYDAEGDFLEVEFAQAAGVMKETDEDAVMERVDAEGRVIGFSILGVSKLAKERRTVVASLEDGK